MRAAELAEGLIQEFGISHPRDLDLEAIAYDNGMQVEYRNLTGCEATLVGYGNHSIATIKRSASPGRERFSIAHELGHWNMHRGRSFRCRVDDPGENLGPSKTVEREADIFAAHLLMPSQLFNPAVKQLGKPGFREIADLSSHFQTSLLATSIRLVHINRLPVIIACYAGKRLRWHLAADDLPKRWWLRDTLDEDTFAFDLVTKGKDRPSPGKQSAEAWFTNDDAEKYEVLEHCTNGRAGEVLVVLYLAENMMDARFDPNVGNRKYNEHGSYIPRRNSGSR